MGITRSNIARQLMARGGMMSETAASYSSPTARAADDRFSPASDSGGDNSSPRENKTFKEKAIDIGRDIAISSISPLGPATPFIIDYLRDKGFIKPGTGPYIPPEEEGDNNEVLPRLPFASPAVGIATNMQEQPNELAMYIQALRSAQPNPFMLAPRFRAADGGRARYGLGSLVKKITKPIKKLVKSDVGKAALAAAGAYYAPALLGRSGYFSGVNPLIKASGKGGISDFIVKSGLGIKDYLRNLTGIGLPPGAKSTMSPTKRILTGLGIGATLSPFFMSGQEEDEETLDQAIARAYGKSDLNIPAIRKAALGYSDPNELYFKLPSAFRLTAAEGGSIDDVIDLSTPEGIEAFKKIAPGLLRREYPKVRKILDDENEIIEIMPKKKPSRIKKAEGGIMGNQKDFEEFLKDMKDRDMSAMQDQILRDFQKYMERKKMIEQLPEAKNGGLMKMAEGGLMDLDGNEMDLRGGGFVPIGAKEKADDVPARLSKNEFVFTADAVRAAGGGSVEKGAQKMYNTMKQLEKMV